MTKTVRWWLVACLLLTCTMISQARQAPSGAWTRQGADAGMTKYTSSDLPASTPSLAYKKHFISYWDSLHWDYFYANSLVVQNGLATIFANELNDNTLRATTFNWQTGATVNRFPQPYLNVQDAWELDSHHFTNVVIGRDDGTIYSRRGGDNRTHYILDPATGSWTQLQLFQPPDNPAWSGDATAFAQIAGNRLFYRWGDARTTGPYGSYDISAGASPFGKYIASVGPTPDGDRYRYGDFPKVRGNVAVLAARVSGYSVVVEAHDATTGAKLWQKTYASDTGGGGTGGWGVGIPDYWRFLITDEGQFVFFHRPNGNSCVVRALNVDSGAEIWSRTLGANDRPLLAAHGGFVYIIGQNQQFKVNDSTGVAVWQANGTFPNDAGYTHHNFANDGSAAADDYAYRSVVLTDSSLWFVDGEARDSGTLIGLNTANGSVVAIIDLAKAVRSGTQTLELVNDIAAADGKLGVLVTIHDSADSTVAKMPYQDLLVYSFGGSTTPPPPSPTDSDGDGVPDGTDACPGTPAGTPVDANGCPLPAPPPPPPPPSDTTAPTVAITNPSAGASVSGTVYLTAAASDNVGVTSVQFLVDGAPIGSATTAPYTVIWNTASVALTSHTNKATASDAAGNSASATESVSVVAVPPPCTSTSPGVSLSPNSTLVTSPGVAVSYTLNITNNDTSGCSTTTFSLGDAVPADWTAGYSAAQLDIPPGSTKTSTLSLTPPSTANGVSNFTASAARMTSQGPGGSTAGSVMVALRVDVTLSIVQANNTQLIAQVKVGSTGLAGANVTFTVIGPTGKTTTLSATTNATGSASVRLQLRGNNSPKGVYQVQVVASGGGLTGNTTGSFINQ